MIEKINDILDEFDFENVATMAAAVNWQHLGDPATASSFRGFAFDCLRALLSEPKQWRVSTGGMEARREPHGMIRLAFVGDYYEVEE